MNCLAHVEAPLTLAASSPAAPPPGRCAPRHRCEGRRPDRARRAGPRGRRRAPPSETPPPLRADEPCRRPTAPASRARAGARGSRAALPRPATVPRWNRSRRTAGRTDRAGRTPGVRRASACRARPSSATPTESASTASPSGSAPSPRMTLGSVTCAPIGSSRRDFRERSMSRHTRETTVVNQPPRFSMVAVSVRLRRSHASCTASSASLSEPSIAVGHSAQPRPVLFEPLGQPALLVHASRSRLLLRHTPDG